MCTAIVTAVDHLGCVCLLDVQGSVTWDHWKINLQFDPMTFESPETGMKIHRGIYLAAKELYDKFAPYVRQHLESSPDAKVSLAGECLPIHCACICHGQLAAHQGMHLTVC